MIVNTHHQHHRPLINRQDSIIIEAEEEEENSKKAPNSFLLYKTKRRHDANGKYISSLQLIEEWKNMSEEQKNEFQNQSQCIQFTLDIDHRKHHIKKLPKIIVPPPSSMVIPNDHSVDSSPIREDEVILYHTRHPQQHHYQPQHHFQHHSLSDLLTSPSHYHHHHQQQQQQFHSNSLPKLHSIYNHHSSQQQNINNNTNTTKSYTMPYSAAAEAAALGSLSFNNNNNNNTSLSQPLPQPTPSNNIKKKYGILPEKVRRPPNAYLLFNRDMRRQLHDINQGLTSGEISKSISKRWKELLPHEKEYYIKEEAKLKQQHNNEHSNFIYTRRSKAEMKQAGLKQQQKSIHVIKPTVPKPPMKRKPNSPTEGRDPRGRKKKKADDTLPKHPMSGYLHFAKEMRPVMKKKYPDARLVEISKHIGVQWRSMSEIELKPWIDIANRDKERYAREMKDRLLNQPVEDDDQSFSSSSTSSTLHTTSLQQYNDNSKLVDATLIEELDSHTIATVAQMVNPTSY